MRCLAQSLGLSPSPKHRWAASKESATSHHVKCIILLSILQGSHLALCCAWLSIKLKFQMVYIQQKGLHSSSLQHLSKARRFYMPPLPSLITSMLSCIDPAQISLACVVSESRLILLQPGGGKATAAVRKPLPEEKLADPDSAGKDSKDGAAVQAGPTSRSQSVEEPSAPLPADAARVQSYTIPAAQWRDQTGRQASFCSQDILRSCLVSWTCSQMTLACLSRQRSLFLP